MSEGTKGEKVAEVTLDPDDWDALRALGHRMLDDMVDHLSSLRAQPAWRAMPDEVRGAFDGPVPRTGQGAEAAYAEFARDVMPYTNGNLHPRFSGWVQGCGTALGMLSDMLASGLNPHLAGFNQAPPLVERQVLAWLTELMGMPAASSGVLTGGGTMANLLGLAVARHARAGFDVRAEGLQGGGRPMLITYCSSEAHGWLKKAVEVLGLGRRALRVLPGDEAFRLDVGLLRDAIEADRAAGHRPMCVVATAGTIDTGAIDDLPAVADVCAETGLWLHVDGAFGALARLAPEARSLVAGLERADSIAFDLHKWMYQPFEIACVLVRDAEAHRGTFSMAEAYLAQADRGVIAGGLPFAHLGIDLTRSFRALKAWMALKAHGADMFGRLIDQNVHHARRLGQLVEDHPRLELLAPVALNVVCFRYVLPGLDDGALDALNREILLRLQERGIAVPSSTLVRGRFAIRSAIVNHRTRLDDVEALAGAVVRLGDELTPTGEPPSRRP